MIATQIDGRIRKGIIGAVRKIFPRLTLERILSISINELEMNVLEFEGELYSPDTFTLIVDEETHKILQEHKIIKHLKPELEAYISMRDYKLQSGLSVEISSVSFPENGMLEVLTSFGQPNTAFFTLTILNENTDTFLLKRPGTYVAGRSENADMIIKEPHVSKRHVEFFLVNSSGLFIRDLNSTNGTVINGVPLFGRLYRKLAKGDSVRLGKFGGVLLEIN